MRRSYINIKENNFKIYEDSKLLNADGIIVDGYDASILFTNFEKYQDVFEKIKDNDNNIYLKVDQVNPRRSYKAIKLCHGKYIDGFVFKNPTNKVIRAFSLKARDYELRQKLNFKSINFIVFIDSLLSEVSIKKIMKNTRVKYIVLDNALKNDNQDFISKVTTLAHEYKKTLVNPEQVTNNLDELNKINEKFTPSINEINKALEFANRIKGSLPEQRQKIIEEQSLVRNYQVLNIAKRLGIIDDYPKIYFEVRKKHEKLEKHPPRIRNFYTFGEEIGNAVTHGVGAGLSIAGLVLLIIKGLNRSGLDLMAYIVFAVSAIILYMMSTLYHSMSMESKAKRIFQKLDHITIYLLIAGTYTPFSLIGIGGETGLYIFIGLWVAALIGILLNVFAFGKYRVFHMILYVAMGWVAVFFMPQIIEGLDIFGIVFLFIGGFMYTLGIAFYSLKLFKYSHMVWHLFVIFGTIFHFFAIFYSL